MDRRAVARSMLAPIDEEEWRRGRLIEDEQVERRIARLAYVRLGVRALMLPQPRSTRVRGTRGYPIHIEHTTVAKTPPERQFQVKGGKRWGRRRRQCLQLKQGAAAAFQAYVERHGESDGLLTDTAGPLLLSTIGDSTAERQAFWTAVEQREHADGRVQARLVIEVRLQAER